MIMNDAMREYEVMKYEKLANEIDTYLKSHESISEGMYLSRKEYEMCSEALKNYSGKKGIKNAIIDWFTKR